MDLQNVKTWTPMNRKYGNFLTKTCITWRSKMWKPGRRNHVRHGPPKCENLDAHDSKIWKFFNEIWLLESFFQPTKNQETMEKNL